MNIMSPFTNEETDSEAMGTCKNHPDRHTGYICQKHNYYLCDSCLACSDPKLYCKFRSSCIIFFRTEKEEGTDGSTSIQASQSLKERINE
jgi:hypothetical protein